MEDNRSHVIMKFINETKSPAVMDYLLNKMMLEPTESLDFYLPSLCYLAITKAHCFQNIQNFVEDLAIKNTENICLRSILLV